MTTIRRFVCDDLFRFNNVNLDPLTETVRAARVAARSRRARCGLLAQADAARGAQYNLPFYLQYLAKWPEYFAFAEGPGGACQGYSARRRQPRLSSLASCAHAPAPRAVMGKAEGVGENWHGHVTAVTARGGGGRASVVASAHMCARPRRCRWRRSTAGRGLR